MKKQITAAIVALAGAVIIAAPQVQPVPPVGAPSPSPRESFLREQAYAEMQRVTGQIDVLQANLEELAARVSRLESARAENDALRAEIAALKASNAELQSRTKSLRSEIVADLTKRLAAIQRDMTPPAPPPAPKPQTSSPAVEPHREYVVQPGDTLSLIAAAFKTTVPRIKEMNNLKSDILRIGQKLMLPL